MRLGVERHVYFEPKLYVPDAGDQKCYKLHIPGVQMLGRYDHHFARAPLPPHHHHGRFEISLLVKGRQTYRVGGRTYRMKGGEQFVTFPNEVHDTAQDPEEKGTLYWIILEAKPNRSGWLSLKPDDARLMIDQLHRLPSRHFNANPASHLVLERLFQVLKKPSTRFGNLEIEHLINHYLFQTIEAARVSAIPAVSPQIHAALDFIAQRKEEDWLDVAGLAQKAGWSEPYFKARFRHEMGVPPAEYMVRRKLESAKKRLSQPGAHVTDVAYDLGFSSSQYFATVFKRYARQTPSQFVASLNSSR